MQNQEFFTNLLIISIELILYHYSIYPHIVFQQRQLFGLSLMSVKKCILQDYLIKLKLQISQLYEIISSLEVILYRDQKPFNSIIFQINDQQIHATNFQRETDAKAMLYKLLIYLSTATHYENQELKIQIYTNGKEALKELSQENLIQYWVQINHNPMGQIKFIESIHNPGFDLLLGAEKY